LITDALVNGLAIWPVVIPLAAAGLTLLFRRWPTLQAYEEEVSNARIWGGFHYRFSTEVGRDMGKKIGELTLATQLRPRTKR